MVTIRATNFDVADLDELRIPADAYNALIQNPAAASARVQRDGSIYLNIPGYGKTVQGTAQKEFMERVAKNAPPFSTAILRRDASGKLVKAPKEGVILR